MTIFFPIYEVRYLVILLLEVTVLDYVGGAPLSGVLSLWITLFFATLAFFGPMVFFAIVGFLDLISSSVLDPPIFINAHVPPDNQDFHFVIPTVDLSHSTN